jgi:hypothetical protein
MSMNMTGDEQGHIGVGWGGASGWVDMGPMTTYSVNAREGYHGGANTSGNQKSTTPGISIEDSGGRAGILLGHAAASGRAWTINSNATGNLTFSDSGQYGLNDGGGTNMTVSYAAGVAVSSSSTSGYSMCVAGSFQTLPTTGFAEGCFAYQVSDRTPYISTATVTNIGHWKALY